MIKLNYKKIFKNQQMRFFILSCLKFIPDKVMIKMQYRIKMDRKLNIKKPDSFTEWIQWYKLYYRKAIMKQCVDKYEVRNFVKEKNLSEIIVENYGVFERFEDIDFSKLPDKFVIKTTHGGGGNNVIICKDKSTLDLKAIKQVFRQWNKKAFDGKGGREWAYYGVQPRIVIEELLEDLSQREGYINDYKFFCFGGKVELCVFDTDRYINHKRNFYDTEWSKLDISSDCNNIQEKIEKPLNYEVMIKIAEKLSKPFPFVRVDLYNINGKIYFGEMTFYPWSGYVFFKPIEIDYKLGKLFKYSIMGDKSTKESYD